MAGTLLNCMMSMAGAYQTRYTKPTLSMYMWERRIEKAMIRKLAVNGE